MPSLELDPSLRFEDVLKSRRTHRVCEPMNLADVLSLIQAVVRPFDIGEHENVGRLRKSSISAGALHPIEVLVVGGPEVSEPIIYCDRLYTFGTVQFRSNEMWANELRVLSTIAPQAVGHLLLFVANERHVAQAYEQPLSLLWRDAGALLQTFSLMATALSYNFVPLGPTGSNLLREIDSPHEDYIAVGTGVIGKAPIRVDAST